MDVQSLRDWYVTELKHWKCSNAIILVAGLQPFRRKSFRTQNGFVLTPVLEWQCYLFFLHVWRPLSSQRVGDATKSSLSMFCWEAFHHPFWNNMWEKMWLGGTWRIIPLSKWLVTPIYKPLNGHFEGEQPYLGDLRSPWLLTTYQPPKNLTL